MQKPILVYRGEHLESTHDLHVAVVNNEGKLLFSYGNPSRFTFPRSSMKPFQAVPLVETGAAERFNYTQSELALSCASHSGEKIHRDSVLNILAKIGLAEEALQCGTHIPRDHESYKQLIREGKELTPVFSNCSGKHSGMLATAVHMKEDVAGYREIHHPVQQRILDVIEDICEVPKNEIKLSVDGCGAPVHQLPLNQMALGYARLAKPVGGHASALENIKNAMVKHPEMVGGKNRFDTNLMNTFNGRIVSKAGAEAVQCIGLVEEGLGIAIKVEDGGERAVSVAAMEVLKQLGLVNEQIYQTLKDYAHAPVFNARNDRIGVIMPNFILEK
ncbi:asparaginase [Neobacillus sp. NRS-1170]|uniref:asparaginase n=1 Tax=Neobacillus sp. NRS-1170 TaxID=3233898 RepID=UPI003D26D43B